MDNSIPEIMQQVAVARHHDRLAQAEAARRLAEVGGARSPRVIHHRARRLLAIALRALASRVAPPRERVRRRVPRVEVRGA
jgi:hypothetical protein